MSNQEVSNEQIYQKLLLIDERLNFHTEKFSDMDTHIKEVRLDMSSQFKEVRSDIAGLKNTRFTWSTMVLAGVTMASSVITLIILRVLNWMGIKLVEIQNYFV